MTLQGKQPPGASRRAISSTSSASAASLCLAVLLDAILAGGLARGASPSPAAAPPQLTAINSRVDRSGVSVVIEASAPAIYVTKRPEPRTVYVEFPNASALGVVNRFVPDVRSPIVAVAVEASDAPGGPASRVRITLAQAVAHRVRSDGKKIIVDFDKLLSDSARASYVLPPASRGVPDINPVVPREAAPPANPAQTLQATAAPSATSQVVSPPGTVVARGAAAGGVVSGEQAALPQNPASQAPAQTLPPSVPPSPGPAERRFTGAPVSLDFQGADLRAVLRTFAEISGLNMVIDPTVQGTVDVAMRDVPWDQALDIILRANKLDYAIEGTIVRIAPGAVFIAETKGREDAVKAKAAERAAEAEANATRAAAEQMTTVTRQLSYARGEDIVKLLVDTRVISKYGQAKFDVRTNTVIISDVATQIPQAQALIDKLDRAQPQVEIEARIVNTNKNYARALGVQWGFSGRVDPTLGNTTNLAFPNNGSLSGTAGTTQVSTGSATTTTASGSATTAVNLPVLTGATSGVGLTLGSINGAFNLDVALSALESTGNVRILSTPRVTTQNNVDAEITQGVKIPVQTTANQTTTTTYVDAALSLKVTPQITAAGTVIMKIAVDNGSRGDTTPDGRVSINTQRANTTVLVGDGQTTVIGGIFSSTNTTNNDRTPGLASVPLLKWLFKRDSMSDTNNELLIFITPRIIR